MWLQRNERRKSGKTVGRYCQPILLKKKIQLKRRRLFINDETNKLEQVVERNKKKKNGFCPEGIDV